MEKIKLIVYGFIVGLGNIIPGVSGGALAILLGIYEKMLNAVNTIFKQFKKNFSFLFFLGIGIALAILVGSVGVKAALDNYKIATTLLFIGLIAGGIPSIYKKIDGKISFVNILIFAVIFVLMTILTFVNGTIVTIDTPTFIDYIKLFVVGIIASATMIIPGISGSMVLMAIGYYDLILGCVANITNFSLLGYHIQILLPFGLGIVAGILSLAKLVEFLLKKYEVKTYFAIFGFIVSSFVGTIYLNITTFDFGQLIVGIVLMVLGFILTYKLSKYESKKESEI